MLWSGSKAKFFNKERPAILPHSYEWCMHAFSAKIVVKMGFFCAKIPKIKKRYIPKLCFGYARKKKYRKCKVCSNKKLCKRQYHAKVHWYFWTELEASGVLRCTIFRNNVTPCDHKWWRSSRDGIKCEIFPILMKYLEHFLTF